MRKIAASTLLAGAFTLAALGQPIEVPLRNWTVPPYTVASTGGGLATMTDVTAPRAFVGIDPCRIADTRGNGFTGQAGPPAIPTAPRTFQIAGTVSGVPAQCGIPTGTEAVSFQFTIVLPNAAGNLVAWPAGGTAPNISVLNWSAGETAIGNGTIVPLSPGGALSVQINAAVSNAIGHLVIDVNGYFNDVINTNQPLALQNVSPGGFTATFANLSTAASSIAVIASTNGQGTHALRGFAENAAGENYGVWGLMQTNTAWAAGVRGSHFTVGRPIGVSLHPAGVRGESGGGVGTYGTSGFAGVVGSLIQSGMVTQEGILGWAPGGGPIYGVYSYGNTGATGVKQFVEPHPTDAGKVIRYVSLEGNEPGTYFRGRGKFHRGMARIVVPEDFRLVTDEEGLTVQVTPIGAMATVGVLKMDLNEIVVQSSRNLEFSYLVQGIRRSHKHLTSPIGEGGEFAPQSAEARMPASLTDDQKRLLVENGTYKEDGTVNMETAKRLGWDRMWQERSRPLPQPSAP